MKSPTKNSAYVIRNTALKDSRNQDSAQNDALFTMHRLAASLLPLYLHLIAEFFGEAMHFPKKHTDELR